VLSNGHSCRKKQNFHWYITIFIDFTYKKLPILTASLWTLGKWKCIILQHRSSIIYHWFI
jgi:hypothetical protein